MEVIPRTLAENAGLDRIDVLTQLRFAHDHGNPEQGEDVFTGGVLDAWKEGVIEPLKIKTLALSSAAEVAEMILRIDDVIMERNRKLPRPEIRGWRCDAAELRKALQLYGALKSAFSTGIFASGLHQIKHRLEKAGSENRPERSIK